mgnify:CR=1 FL=1
MKEHSLSTWMVGNAIEKIECDKVRPRGSEKEMKIYTVCLSLTNVDVYPVRMKEDVVHFMLIMR